MFKNIETEIKLLILTKIISWR